MFKGFGKHSMNIQVPPSYMFMALHPCKMMLEFRVTVGKRRCKIEAWTVGIKVTS